jgi:hypothetical protein
LFQIDDAQDLGRIIFHALDVHNGYSQFGSGISHDAAIFPPIRFGGNIRDK